MLADGNIVTCSRSKRGDLFALALGGYGLFGVILDADIQLASNACNQVERHVVAAGSYPTRYCELVLDRLGSGLAYGRLCVTKEGFLNEAIITVAREIPTPAEGIPTLKPPSVSAMNRMVFRGSVDSD